MWWKILRTIAEEMEEPWHETISRIISIYRQDRYVLENRENRTRQNIHDYDVVYGPIANDDVGLLIRRLTAGLIDVDKFLEELKFKKGITFQYFFATEKSIKYLERV